MNYERRLRPFFSGFTIILILIGFAVFAAYYAYNHFIGSSTNDYISSISKINSKVATANGAMEDILKQDSDNLPVEQILDQIPSSYDILSEVSKDFSAIIPPSTYSDSHEKLKEALDLNKSVYKQLEIILTDPSSQEMQKKLNLLGEYAGKCANNYMDINIKNVSFMLPDEIASIKSKVEPWARQKQTEYANVYSLIDSFSKYFDNMARLFALYDSSSADFNQILSSVRNGQETYENLLSQIDKSEGIVKSVKSDYEKLPVPEELKKINKRFGPILDEQLSYYTKLKFAVQAEKGLRMLNPGEQQVDTLYKEVQKSFQSFSLNYQQFALDLKGEKDKYMDPEFVLKLKTQK